MPGSLPGPSRWKKRPGRIMVMVMYIAPACSSACTTGAHLCICRPIGGHLSSSSARAPACTRGARRASLLLPPTGREAGFQGCGHPRIAGVSTRSRLAYRFRSSRLRFLLFLLPLLPPLCFFAAGSSPAASPARFCCIAQSSSAPQKRLPN